MSTKTLYVRNVPDELYQAIRTLAEEGQRSITDEVIEILQDAVTQLQVRRRRRQAMDRIAARRNRFHLQPDSKDTAALIREDRER
ncbi:MAG TPA: Arc family DNA-binding protein [Armatimonadota bacterium]|jgi:plasmid stability protein